MTSFRQLLARRKAAGPGLREPLINSKEDCVKKKTKQIIFTSLRVGGGEQDQAPEELKAKWRKTVLEEKLFRINLTNTGSDISCSLEDLWVKSL